MKVYKTIFLKKYFTLVELAIAVCVAAIGLIGAYKIWIQTSKGTKAGTEILNIIKDIHVLTSYMDNDFRNAYLPKSLFKSSFDYKNFDPYNFKIYNKSPAEFKTITYKVINKEIHRIEKNTSIKETTFCKDIVEDFKLRPVACTISPKKRDIIAIEMKAKLKIKAKNKIFKIRRIFFPKRIEFINEVKYNWVPN